MRGEKLEVAYLLSARIDLARGDTVSAVRALDSAAANDPRWKVSLEAGRTLARLGRTADAADALLAAFERGALEDAWVEIAEAQRAAGRGQRAAILYDLIARKRPDLLPQPTPPPAPSGSTASTDTGGASTSPSRP